MNSPTYTPLPRDPGPTEFIAESLSVYNQECLGCQTHGRHVMVSFSRKGEPLVYDLFLTREQAKNLTVSLLDLVAR